MIVLLWQQGHGWRPYLPWTASLCTSVYNEQYVIILFLLQTARNQVRGTPETMPSPAEGCPWSEVECDWSEVYFDLYLVSCFFFWLMMAVMIITCPLLVCYTYHEESVTCTLWAGSCVVRSVSSTTSTVE